MRNILLTEERFRIIQAMFRFIDRESVGADELLDCDIDDYNNLSKIFDD